MIDTKLYKASTNTTEEITFSKGGPGSGRKSSSAEHAVHKEEHAEAKNFHEEEAKRYERMANAHKNAAASHDVAISNIDKKLVGWGNVGETSAKAREASKFANNYQGELRRKQK